MNNNNNNITTTRSTATPNRGEKEENDDENKKKKNNKKIKRSKYLLEWRRENKINHANATIEISRSYHDVCEFC